MKPILLFAFLLLSISMASATDCWQLTNESGELECFYISFENCNDTYYDEFFDCERERLDIELKEENIIQKLSEKIAPDYESEILTKLYTFSNIQIFFFSLFSYLLYWMFDNRQ